MVSFKLKLVSYFVLLTLVPLGAAFWGFNALAQRSEARSADGRLQVGLRSALFAYRDEVNALGSDARTLVESEPFVRALRNRDRGVLADFASANGNLRIESGAFRVGARPPRTAVSRSIDVVVDDVQLGEVTAWLP